MHYLFINFKAYKESTAENSIRLIKEIEENFPNQDNIIPILNPLDAMVHTRLKKFIQHADPVLSGARTGQIPVDLLPSYGFRGVLLNHSEKRIKEEDLKNTIKLCKENNIETIVCAETLEEIRKFLELKPNFIAYEPPELIGGNISVSKSKPEVIYEAAKVVGENSIFIVGAGIKTKEDVTRSIELGAKGVLVASGIVLSKNPIMAIREMLAWKV